MQHDILTKGDNQMSITQAQRMESVPFSEIRSLVEKSSELEKQGADIIHLEVGRPDFDTPSKIKECAKRCLDEGKVHYTSNYGAIELREAIARKLLRDNKLHYDPKTEIMVTVGVTEGLSNVLNGLLNSGDEILVPNPVWLNYMHVPRMLGAVPVSYNLLEENDYQIDTEEIEKNITNKTKMLVLISPNNPTGGVLGKDLLHKLAAIAIKHDLIVISDEIYEKIIYDGHKHFSIAEVPGMKERTIVLNGFSKAYSMTGWRLGYIATTPNLLNAAVRNHQYTTTCAPSFAQYAAVEALDRTIAKTT
jgi:aminotransferase